MYTFEEWWKSCVRPQVQQHAGLKFMAQMAWEAAIAQLMAVWCDTQQD